MRTLRYLGRLLGELFTFAGQNKSWWIVPIALMLLMLSLFIVASTGVVPWLIYTI